MKKVSIYDIPMNAFQMIGNEWMLITAKKADGSFNTMTASWGGAGVLWNKPVVTAYIRPQRYTKEFVDESETFTLTFFGGDYMKEMGYLGRVSGRDEDKIANAGMKPVMIDGEPTFDGATVTLICKKLYEDNIKPENFKDMEIDSKCYPFKDYHQMYIAEVIACYVAE